MWKMNYSEKHNLFKTSIRVKFHSHFNLVKYKYPTTIASGYFSSYRYFIRRMKKEKKEGAHKFVYTRKYWWQCKPPAHITSTHVDEKVDLVGNCAE